MNRKRSVFAVGRMTLTAVLGLLFVYSVPLSWSKTQQERPVRLLHQFQSFSSFPSSASWGGTVPQVKRITIKSSADGKPQPALYYNSGNDRKKPLLVALHSWSDNYNQRISIPYALWAVVNDWVFIHPDYRGIFNNPDATGSELVVQDIVDAVQYARKNANIDPQRIYLMGFSGGAMTALIMAGRHPELWSAVAAFVPVYNLTDWYEYVIKFPNRHYARHIEASCGGVPDEGSAAARECNRRSPSAYLKNARGKSLRIYVAHGIQDDFAPPGNSLRVFNELAESEDRISEQDIEYINSRGKIPSHLTNECFDKLYEEAESPLIFRKTSANVTISLFDGKHDVLYNAGLQWLSRQTAAQGERRP